MPSIQPESFQRQRGLKRGCKFTVMVAGSGGLGKTSFLNSLLEQELIKETHFPNPAEAGNKRDITIQSETVEREFFGNKVALTLLDVNNFGDNINNEDCFNVLLEYIESKYKEVLEEESRIKRNPRFEDNRVDVMLYFIAPSGRGLTDLDKQAMKVLGKRVNIIPILAKADAYCAEELAKMKALVLNDIQKNQIEIYDFSFDPDEVEECFADENNKLKKMLPFSVICADLALLPKKGRKYPWGFVDIEDANNSNFAILKSVLFNSHLQDLKERTQNILYENYRTEALMASQSQKSGYQNTGNYIANKNLISNAENSFSPMTATTVQ